jgi:hypothetical protein
LPESKTKGVGIMEATILKFPSAKERAALRKNRPTGHTESMEPTILKFPSLKAPSAGKRTKRETKRKASE